MSRPKNSIITGNGNVVHLLEPRKEQIHLVDISLSLSKICRYSGGTIQFYSVAQHSLNCCKIAREMYDIKIGIYLLLHDSAEAYISDVPTPVRKLVPGFDEIERNLLTAIYHHFCLEKPTGNYLNKVQEIDSRILANEIPVLVPKLKCIIPENCEPYEMNLDFMERKFDDVKEEFEDTVNYLLKKM